MLDTIIGNLFLILSLAAVAAALYYGIRKMARAMEDNCREHTEHIEDPAAGGKNMQSAKDDCEVNHAAGKNRRRKSSGMHLLFSNQPEGHTERGKVRPGKQPLSHGFIR